MSDLFFNPAPAAITPRHAHKFKQCEGKCREMRPPERGVQIGSKWHCAACAAPILRRMQ